MNKTQKGQLRKNLLKRDRNICGAHLGGCQLQIGPNENFTIDHIIPESITKRIRENQDRRTFQQDWNLQPMHRECNSLRKAGVLNGWPAYQCQCHFLQVEGSNLYIYANTTPTAQEPDWVKHLFQGNMLSPPYDPLHTREVLGYFTQQKMSGGGTARGIVFPQGHREGIRAIWRNNRTGKMYLVMDSPNSVPNDDATPVDDELQAIREQMQFSQTSTALPTSHASTTSRLNALI